MTRRVAFWAVSLLCLAAVIFSLSACTMYNGNTSFEEKDGVSYILSGYVKCCFVTCITIPEGQTQYEVTIPDKLDSGHKVEGLGGYTGTGVPTPCDIAVDGMATELITDHDEYMEMLEAAEFTDYELTVNVGKYVDMMRFVCFSVYGDYEPYFYLKTTDGENENAVPRYVRIHVSFNVSEDNEYFYSADGIAYEKEDDTQ